MADAPQVFMQNRVTWSGVLLPQDRDSRVHCMGLAMSRQTSCSFHLPAAQRKGRLHGHFAVYSPRHYPLQLQSDDGHVG